MGLVSVSYVQYSKCAWRGNIINIIRNGAIFVR